MAIFLLSLTRQSASSANHDKELAHQIFLPVLKVTKTCQVDISAKSLQQSQYGKCKLKLQIQS